MKWLRSDSYSLPVALAIGLHAGIVLTAVLAVDFSDSKKTEPKRPVIVNAKVVDVSQTIIGQREAEKKAAQKQAAAIAKQKKKAAEQARKKEIARKALEDKRKKAAQAQRKKEQDAAKKKQEAERKAAEQKRIAQATEKKKQAQEAEKKRLAEEKRQQELKRQQKQREEALIRQAEADRLAEQERKRQEEAARLAEEKRAKELAAQKAAAEEEAKRLAAEETQMVQSISSLINARVAAAWSRPPSARNGMKTELRIDFLPNGEVMNAQVIKGSGDALFDQRALDAINKVRRIEELAEVDSYIFERNFRKVDLIFNPQDLRN
ncbi:cell envelope integrity protein TolA [Marinomonas posidonica]|uniref:Protein TolA n=1 Tax=Marinomonas posidonica (strain CECT 7376 / NCIMB 14433 / IVIA-Po-181) TaxID=491952 RepID=F6D0K3_MARPP|nr:cell envelope integrity protein TolA [Marinomonas posidonica]AEF54801.1 protein TolA [Marinomonas posidonica IVIA-Po-181]